MHLRGLLLSTTVTMSPAEHVPAEFSDPVKSKALTKRVLWKLDTHVLPALALVRPCSQSMC